MTLSVHELHRRFMENVRVTTLYVDPSRNRIHNSRYDLLNGVPA